MVPNGARNGRKKGVPLAFDSGISQEVRPKFGL